MDPMVLLNTFVQLKVYCYNLKLILIIVELQEVPFYDRTEKRFDLS